MEFYRTYFGNKDHAANAAHFPRTKVLKPSTPVHPFFTLSPHTERYGIRTLTTSDNDLFAEEQITPEVPEISRHQLRQRPIICVPPQAALTPLVPHRQTAPGRDPVSVVRRTASLSDGTLPPGRDPATRTTAAILLFHADALSSVILPTPTGGQYVILKTHSSSATSDRKARLY